MSTVVRPQQLQEEGDVDGPARAAEETARCTDMDDGMTACCDGLPPADINTPQKHASSRERQTRRDERLIHQMALLNAADNRGQVMTDLITYLTERQHKQGNRR